MTYQATDIAKYIINKCTIEKHAILRSFENTSMQKHRGIFYYVPQSDILFLR